MEIDGESDVSWGADVIDDTKLSDVIAAIKDADLVHGIAVDIEAPVWPLPGSSSVLEPAPSQAPVLVPASELVPAPNKAVMAPVGNGRVDRPVVKIIEQPASKAARFRYICEGRSAGSITGANSTAERRTYPTIQIKGFTGVAHVFVSCVCKDPEITDNKKIKYRPHPHNLVGRDRCKDGICTVEVNGVDPTFSFSNLGVQCVKRREIDAALRLREEKKIDPFRTGFAHRNQPQSIDLNAVRLCFQVFILEEGGRMRPLPPVVSDVIYDKKALSDLAISRVSHCAGPVTGGTEMILLCEKVAREEISVVFYEVSEERTVWEAPANVILVHKQYAIVLQTPPYRIANSSSHHKVRFELRRRDDSRSTSLAFEYTPSYTEPFFNAHKKPRTASFESERYGVDKKDIKLEPRDRTPPHITSPQSYEQRIAELEAGPSHAYLERQYMNPWAPRHMMLPAQSISPSSHQAQGMSPHHELSPMHRGQTLSPMQQVLSPVHQVLSPMQHGQAVSPMHHGQAVSPMHHGQAVSPMHHGQNLSPMHPNQSLSPMIQGQALSPMQDANVSSPMQQGQTLSPMHHNSAQSPMQQSQALSPMHRAHPMSPGQHNQVMQHLEPLHMHPNRLGNPASHGSNFAMSHVHGLHMENVQHSAAPLETISDPASLTRLLQMPTDLQLNSGELRNMEELLDAMQHQPRTTHH